jgi:hypothetical protein
MATMFAWGLLCDQRSPFQISYWQMPSWRYGSVILEQFFKLDKNSAPLSPF